jgi:ubiquinone/menaquinone biosynthesis C-methylase UbiE
MDRKYDLFFKTKIELIAREKKILDVGGGNPFQKGMQKYKHLFKDISYETIDYNNYYKPTIVGNVEDMPIKNNSYDGVVCISVLEHVNHPHKVISEIHRILKKGGKAIFFVPSIYPYHARTGKGAYPDNFRYFHDGIKVMCKDFSKIQIVKCAGFFETIFKFFLFSKILTPYILNLGYILDNIFNTRSKSEITSGYYFYLEK